mmetsp:Transcript_48172/g.137597  ORF Transcript_48172/g.137597 Transcript_48172/m.137597 type:complete len:216 (-) Transcript_48172:468-1115(-)
MGAPGSIVDHLPELGHALENSRPHILQVAEELVSAGSMPARAGDAHASPVPERGGHRVTVCDEGKRHVRKTYVERTVIVHHVAEPERVAVNNALGQAGRPARVQNGVRIIARARDDPLQRHHPRPCTQLLQRQQLPPRICGPDAGPAGTAAPALRHNGMGVQPRNQPEAGHAPSKLQDTAQAPGVSEHNLQIATGHDSCQNLPVPILAEGHNDQA